MFQLSPRISITGDVLGTCHGFHCLYKNSIKISTQWELHDTRCVNLKTKIRSIMLLSQPIRPLVKNIHGLRSSYGLTAIVARGEIIGTVKKHRVINLLMNLRRLIDRGFRLSMNIHLLLPGWTNPLRDVERF